MMELNLTYNTKKCIQWELKMGLCNWDGYNFTDFLKYI